MSAPMIIDPLLPQNHRLLHMYPARMGLGIEHRFVIA